MNDFPSEERITFKSILWFVVLAVIASIAWDLLTSSHVK